MTQRTTDLRTAIAEATAARAHYFLLCLSVWSQIERAEPELAIEIRSLGFDDEAAAAWICSPLADIDESPAEIVAAGRGAEILERIRQTMHGFVA